LPIVEPADEATSFALWHRAEVSALPDGGTVADLDASGDVVFAVGGLVGVSAAKTGAIPMESAKAANARRRVILLSWSQPNSPKTERFEVDSFPSNTLLCSVIQNGTTQIC